MSGVLLYNRFFRDYVLRKKQNIVNPTYFGISEIFLPRESVIHYLAKHEGDMGPSPSEPFISNYLGENVYINFTEGYDVILGKTSPVVFERKKAIKKYRSSHFNYGWTRNIDNVFNKRDNLIVWNHALTSKGIRYRTSLFASYEKYYNDYYNLFNKVNEVTEKKTRHQFIKLELPNTMPNFKALQQDMRHFENAGFKGKETGKLIPNREMLKRTKGEECYWLLDLLAYLTTDITSFKTNESEKDETKHKPYISLWNLLSDESKEQTDVIFTYQSKCFIINLKLIESWFREVKEEGQRENAFKRVYLALKNLTNNTEFSEDNVEEESGKERNPEENSDEKEGGQTSSVQEPEQESTVPDSVDILDILSGEQPSDEGGDETSGTETGGDSSGDDHNWTEPVDEDLLEEKVITQEDDITKNRFNTLESGVKLSLDRKSKEGVMSRKEYDFFMKKATQYKDIVLPNGETVENFIEIDEKELRSIDGRLKGNFTTIKNESLLNARSTVLRKEYVEKFYHKDLLKTLVGFQNSGVCISDLQVSEVADIEGQYELYKVQFHPVGGSPSTREIVMPKILEDGSFKVDGVKNILKNQRMELPIRKTAHDTVVLTSYYDKKLIVKRSPRVADNFGLWFIKQIIKEEGLNGAYSFKLGGHNNRTHHLPYLHSLLSRKFKTLTLQGGIEMSFNMDTMLKEHPEASKINGPTKAVVGFHDDKFVVIDDYNNVYLGDELLGDISTLLNIDTKKAPIECVTMNLNGYNYPIVVLLCYYFGLDKLLKVTKANYRSVPANEKPKPSSDEFVIPFNDEFLVFNRNDRDTSLIFGGLTKFKNTANFNRVDLNEGGVWLPLIAEGRVKSNHFMEMDNLYRLFIDPITKKGLERLKYSVDFDYLLIDAVKLLRDSYAKHEVEIEEQRIVGYERFCGHLYRELCKENRQFQTRGGSKKVFSINPTSVITSILKDTSSNQVEEVGPIHQLKDQEEMTFGGDGGRKDEAMIARTRTQLKSYRGLVSEAHKDSQKVGYVTYGTSDTNVSDFRGNTIVNGKKLEAGSLASVTGHLYYGSFKDDQFGSPQMETTEVL